MNDEVALIVIYNHKYVENIAVIEKIYKSRFSNIYHLVPFYEGTKENVIAVYENSYCFQGYVAQGFKQFYKTNYKHYFFIADDLILNPAIDENNYGNFFDLDITTDFISELIPMPSKKWSHNRSAVTYNPYQKGVETENEIPAFNEVKKVFKRLNITDGPYSPQEIYFDGNYSELRLLIKQTIKYLYDKYVQNTDFKKSKYPLVRSYADIFIISAGSIKKFTHYCGVFAATNLWVEVAIPTALVLSSEKIKLERELQLQGRALWSADDYKILDVFDLSLKNLLNHFPEKYIYLHPIKLSKWNINI